MDSSRILVFARAPVPGRCKTRLIPRLGADGAAALHRRLITQTLRTANGSGTPVELWCAPDTGHGFFARCRREFGVKLHRQCTGDLGRRMALALQQSLCDATRVILVGTDCPTLTKRDLQDALQVLETVDAVLQPATDGGYVLIGARRRISRALQGVDWSSGHELAQTRRRLARANFTWDELPSRDDLDTPADYRRARRHGTL